jgi:GTPase
MRQLTNTLGDHHRGCVAFVTTKKDDVKREQIKKGVVLLSSLDLAKNVCYRFKAVITLFTKSITLKTGYTPVLHLFTIRQSARMIIDPADNNGNDVITYDGSGSSGATVAVVTFKFKLHPEYIEPYNLFVLRSGDIQGIGLVISTLPIDQDDDAEPDPVKVRSGRNKKNRGQKWKPKHI